MNDRAWEAPLDDRPGQPRVILAVEDEPLVRIAIAQHLREAGFVVFETRHAMEALTLLSSGARIDLVFSDVMMPGTLDGAGLARWILAQRPGLPVLLTTGLPGQLAPDLDVPVLPKPYDLDRVVREIRLLLNPTGPNIAG